MRKKLRVETCNLIESVASHAIQEHVSGPYHYPKETPKTVRTVKPFTDYPWLNLVCPSRCVSVEQAIAAILNHLGLELHVEGAKPETVVCKKIAAKKV